MEKSKILKGAILTIIAAIMPMLATTPVMWSVILIMSIGQAAVYFGKNKWYRSITTQGSLDLRDLLSMILLAIGTAIVSGIATIAGTGHIDWVYMWHLTYTTAIPVISGYFVSTLMEGSTKPPPIQ
jgi:hypothetical protein